MITNKMIIEAQNTIVEIWGENGKKVISECAHAIPFYGGIEDFLKHCTRCDGNGITTLLSGIKRLYPNVWAAIPNNTEASAWGAICSTLILCGVDTL